MKGGVEFSWAGLVGYTGAILFLGWIASAGYFQVAKHWDQTAALKIDQTKVIPALKSIAGCQEYRDKILSGQIAARLPNCPSVRSALIPPAAIPVPQK